MITAKDVRELMEKMAEDYGQSEFDSFRRATQNRTGSNAFDFRTSKPKPAAPKRVNYERNVKPKTTEAANLEKAHIAGSVDPFSVIGTGATIAANKAKDLENRAISRDASGPVVQKKKVGERVYARNGVDAGVIERGRGEYKTADGQIMRVENNELDAESQRKQNARLDPATVPSMSSVASQVKSALRGISRNAQQIADDPGKWAMNIAQRHDENKKQTLPYYGMTMQEARLASAKKSALARGESWDKDKENMINKMPISVGSRETFSNMGAYDPLQETLAGGERLGGGNIPMVNRIKRNISAQSFGADIEDPRIVYGEDGNQTSRVAYGLDERKLQGDSGRLGLSGAHGRARDVISRNVELRTTPDGTGYYALSRNEEGKREFEDMIARMRFGGKYRRMTPEEFAEYQRGIHRDWTASDARRMDDATRINPLLRPAVSAGKKIYNFFAGD